MGEKVRDPTPEGQVQQAAGGAGPSTPSGERLASKAALKALGLREASEAGRPAQRREGSLRPLPAAHPGPRRPPFGRGPGTAPAGLARPVGRTHRRPGGQKKRRYRTRPRS